jgi:hypothetical protein
MSGQQEDILSGVAENQTCYLGLAGHVGRGCAFHEHHDIAHFDAVGIRVLRVLEAYC